MGRKRLTDSPDNNGQPKEHQDARLSLPDALRYMPDERNMQNDGNDQTGEAQRVSEGKQ